MQFSILRDYCPPAFASFLTKSVAVNAARVCDMANYARRYMPDMWSLAVSGITLSSMAGALVDGVRVVHR